MVRLSRLFQADMQRPVSGLGCMFPCTCSCSAALLGVCRYASAFYGPFREALDSNPRFGNKKT